MIHPKNQIVLKWRKEIEISGVKLNKGASI